MKSSYAGSAILATFLSLTLLILPGLSVAENNSSVDLENQYGASSQSNIDSPYGNSLDDKDGTKKAKKRQPNWAKLADKLDLEEAQKASFIEVMASQHAKRKAIKANSGVKEAMDSVNLETRQSLASVLSEEQMAKFVEHQQQRKNRKKHSRKKQQQTDTAG